MTGTIRFPQDAVRVLAALVVVRLGDVSRADAATTVVAEMRIASVQVLPGGDQPFELDVPPERIDERDWYSLAVHVDVTGSGEVKGGDLITMRSYPVLTHGHPDEVAVEVHRVVAG